MTHVYWWKDFYHQWFFWIQKMTLLGDNDRSHANERDGLHLMKKYPISIITTLGVTWCEFTRPCFFQKGERLNSQAHCDRLFLFYKREGDRLFGNKNWGIQQGRTSSHTNNRAQQWCKNNFGSFIPKETWPMNSSELNPIDYSIWIKISSHMAYRKIKAINDLRREIERSIKKIDIYYAREVISAFLRRVHSVEKHHG